MAKSQLRSGREPKKPKKERSKAAPTPPSLWSTLEKQPGPSQGANRGRTHGDRSRFMHSPEVEKTTTYVPADIGGRSKEAPFKNAVGVFLNG